MGTHTVCDCGGEMTRCIRWSCVSCGIATTTNREQIVQLESEVERLKDDIRYWSYCTWKGMKSTCPEKEETLRKRFAELKISPWIDPTK